MGTISSFNSRTENTGSWNQVMTGTSSHRAVICIASRMIQIAILQFSLAGTTMMWIGSMIHGPLMEKIGHKFPQRNRLTAE